MLPLCVKAKSYHIIRTIHLVLDMTEAKLNMGHNNLLAKGYKNTKCSLGYCIPMQLFFVICAKHLVIVKIEVFSWIFKNFLHVKYKVKINS